MYRAEIKLGEKTSTGDREGEIVYKKEVDSSSLEINKVNKVLKSFIGKQTQKPPMYSAIKISRKKTL